MQIRITEIGSQGSLIHIFGRDRRGRPHHVVGEHRPMWHFIEAWRAAGMPAWIGYDPKTDSLSLPCQT